MIYLVRHGQSTLNAMGVRHGAERDPGLTEVGVKQAAEAGAELAHLTNVLILTSPLLRARQTADVIAQHVTHHAVVTAWGLAERLYDGGWMESCGDAAERAAAVLAGFDGDLVAVTHAGVLRGLLNLVVTPPNGSVHKWT